MVLGLDNLQTEARAIPNQPPLQDVAVSSLPVRFSTQINPTRTTYDRIRGTEAILAMGQRTGAELPCSINYEHWPIPRQPHIREVRVAILLGMTVLMNALAHHAYLHDPSEAWLSQPLRRTKRIAKWTPMPKKAPKRNEATGLRVEEVRRKRIIGYKTKVPRPCRTHLRLQCPVWGGRISFLWILPLQLPPSASGPHSCPAELQ